MDLDYFRTRADALQECFNCYKDDVVERLDGEELSEGATHDDFQKQRYGDSYMDQPFIDFTIVNLKNQESEKVDLNKLAQDVVKSIIKSVFGVAKCILFFTGINKLQPSQYHPKKAPMKTPKNNSNKIFF